MRPSHPHRRAGTWLAAVLILCWLVLAGDAQAQAAAGRPPVIQLREASQVIAVDALGSTWVDARGDATIEQVSAPQNAGRFRPATADTIHELGNHAALWVHLRLVRPHGERQGWMLEVPMPVVDRVTVYQQDGNRWRTESAGDTLAVTSWPEPGRHPFFRLDMPHGQARDVYVRVRHSTSANFPLELVTESAHDQRIQLEYLGLGLTFGALLLLIAVCLTQSWVYRDRVYAWYAVYATVTALAVATYTGVAGHLLWPSFGALADSPQVILTYCAAAAALLFVRNLIGIAGRYPLADTAVFVLGLAGFGLALLHHALPKLTGLSILGAYIVAATIINVLIALAAWRRGDAVGMWVFIAYVPLAASVAMGVSRMFGWLPVSFASQYAIVVAMALEVPLLLVALSIRSRERHGAQIREQALSTQDALTGLLAPHLFHDRLRQVVTRFKRDRENAAVIIIDLVNHPRIKQHYGSAVAEQSLLRSVIKLRRLLRDVDTVSRIGEARFGVILEGEMTRTIVTERMARLIAAGLMPLKGLKPEVTLQFHVAGVLLDERMIEADELVPSLAELLATMSPRTRRPIRFMAPIDTQPQSLQDSSILTDEGDSVMPQEKVPLAVVK